MSMTATALTMRISYYDIIMRLLGSTWFLLLAVFMARGAITGFETTPWLQTLSRLCLAAFYLTLWFLILTRPPAKAESSGLLPRVAAFVGTYMPWTITFAAPTALALVAPTLLSMICVMGGAALMLYTIWHLGRSFSVVPQARSVVKTGPYQWIKHPLYLSEEIAVLGVVLQFLSPLTVAILIAHIAVQVYRILYEEKLLHTLPEYHAYSESRWRLLRSVW
jgi:protein-S-isoprenylcysteine O-methyltransferase Ste14